MENLKKKISECFIDNLSKEHYVGVEIEMPIINKNCPYIVERQVVNKLFEYLISNDFIPIAFDNDGNCISVRNIDTEDVIALEYSLNTLEFSLEREKNIFSLEEKFINYYNICNNYLKKYQYVIKDVGINPNIHDIDRKCLNVDRYKAVEKVLKREDVELFGEFCSYCCSIQTHINVSKETVLGVCNAFTEIEDLKKMLFSNSYMEETGLKDSRNYLWKTSNFGPENTGGNPHYNTLDDLIEDYMEKTLYYVKRDGKFVVLKHNQRLVDYYNQQEVEAVNDNGEEILIVPEDDDFDYFRSYRSAELTRFGTIEIRTDCTQRIERLFPLVAFNVGIAVNADLVYEYVHQGKADMKGLIDLAIDGLKQRGYGEEGYWSEINEKNWFMDV